MTVETVKDAQDFLTVTNNGQVKRIIDIEMLLERHGSTMVLSFLKDILKEKQRILRDLVVTDKTTPKVNETIAAMFRIHMAIKTIEREREVRAT
jgi:hypothetical protein